MHICFEKLDTKELKKMNDNVLNRSELVDKICDSIGHNLVKRNDVRLVLRHLDKVVKEINWEYKRVKIGSYFIGPYFKNGRSMYNAVTNEYELSPSRYYICCEVDRMYTRDFNLHIKRDFLKTLSDYLDFDKYIK